MINKKILSGILALSLLISTVPSTSFADTEDYAIKYDPENPKYKTELNPETKDVKSLASGFTTVSPYTNKTYTHNDKFKYKRVIHGIDVSYWQSCNTSINWTKVKNDGIKFAIIRAAYRDTKKGELHKDSYYKENITNANKAGIKVGAYIFSQALSEKEAEQEAKYIIKQVKAAGIIPNMSLVLDYEYAGRLSSGKVSKTKATAICLKFYEIVKAAGYTPMVYANYYMLTNDMKSSTVDAKYPVWLAQYNNRASYTGNYRYWQYSSSGSVSGISGRCDMNFWYQNQTIAIKNATTSSLTLGWNSIQDATGYKIYRYNEQTKIYDEIIKIENVEKRSYKDTGLKQGKKYYYKICGFYLDDEGNEVLLPMSDKSTGATKPKQVTGFQFTASRNHKIAMKWNKTSIDSKYKIFRYDPKKKRYKLIGRTKSTKFINTNLKKSKKYKYYVCAYTSADCIEQTGASSSKKIAKTKFKNYAIKYYKEGKVNSNKIAVRKNAGTTYSQITKVSKGKPVTITAYKKDIKGHKWYLISFKKGLNNYKGYIHSKYISIN